MKPDEIKLSDWARILLGEVPPAFYLELAIRTILVYALLQFSLRLLGKRMANQMNLIEMTAMVSLAASIGVPMLSYDQGLLPSFAVAAVIVGIARTIARLNFRSQRFEESVQGDVEALVEDCRLNLKAMKRARISHDRVFAQLRSEQVYHLGAVKRLYMEANGSFSIVGNEDKKPGLSVVPHWDHALTREMLRTTDLSLCARCGTEMPGEATAGNPHSPCPRCSSRERTRAVVERSEEN